MKIVLLFTIIIVSAAVVPSSNVYGTHDFILLNQYLGCKLDTLRSAEHDSFILALVDSLGLDGFETKYDNDRELWGRHIFDFDPCLHMYSIWTGRDLSYVGEGGVFKSVLFNSCDSSIYSFGGSPEKFSGVVRHSLSDKLSKDEIVELFAFYINTLSETSKYIPLRHFSDFNEHFQSQINLVVDNTKLSETWVKENWGFDKDMKICADLITPLEFKYRENSIYLNICSWGREYGNLDYWRIKISQSSFEILERKELIRGVGPRKFEE
jgi:hypothetical protein